MADPPGAAKAQDPNDFAGKVLRLRDDGAVPPDNPFVGRAGYRPEIYTMGHRNPLGLAVEPDNGGIWECEDGPNGGNEVNILQPGKNYGWPVVSFGRFYLGPRVSDNPWHEGMELPVVYWVPAIAISGMTFSLATNSQLEEQRFRRGHAARRSPAFGPPGADRLQRQMGRAPP